MSDRAVTVRFSPDLARDVELTAAANGMSVEKFIEMLAVSGSRDVRSRRLHGRVDTYGLKITQLWQEGLTDEQIALELGVTRSSVASKRYALGLPSRGRGNGKRRSA